jgi:hypothetical protein
MLETDMSLYLSQGLSQGLLQFLGGKVRV